MAPFIKAARTRAAPAPRTRGDGPTALTPPRSTSTCSPHTRGWPPRRSTRAQPGALLPAHAGMAPAPAGDGRGRSAAPRTRGDGSARAILAEGSESCSPHTRGWPHAVADPQPGLRAAPRTRGDGPQAGTFSRTTPTCSPHTRGWPLLLEPHGLVADLLPAHAGMAPTVPVLGSDRVTAPRTRGDGPSQLRVIASGESCSPHTRGWPLTSGNGQATGQLLPAHAGMAPLPQCDGVLGGSAPRTRGDGPHHEGPTPTGVGCSPHTRGWPPSGRLMSAYQSLLPAHVGMAPLLRPAASSAAAAPRTRGDGPTIGGVWFVAVSCSPHMRG